MATKDELPKMLIFKNEHIYNVASNLMDLGSFLANKLQKSSEGKEDGCSAVTSKEAVHSTTISVEVFICYRFEVMLYIL